MEITFLHAISLSDQHRKREKIDRSLVKGAPKKTGHNTIRGNNQDFSDNTLTAKHNNAPQTTGYQLARETETGITSRHVFYPSEENIATYTYGDNKQRTKGNQYFFQRTIKFAG